MSNLVRFQSWRSMTAATQALLHVRDLDEALELLRSHAREIVRADGVTVVRRDGDQVSYVGEDAIGPLWTGQSFPIRFCISGMAMLERRPIVIPDIRRDPRVPLNAYLSTFVASMAVFPLGTPEPVAALGAYWRTAAPIEPDALTLLDALASSANATFQRLFAEGEARAG